MQSSCLDHLAEQVLKKYQVEVPNAKPLKKRGEAIWVGTNAKGA